MSLASFDAKLKALRYWSSTIGPPPSDKNPDDGKPWIGEWREPKPGELSDDLIKRISIYPDVIRSFLMQVRDTRDGLDFMWYNVNSNYIHDMLLAHVVGKVCPLLDKIDKYLEARELVTRE